MDFNSSEHGYVVGPVQWYILRASSLTLLWSFMNKIVYTVVAMMLVFFIGYLFFGIKGSLDARPCISQLSQVFELFPASSQEVEAALEKTLKRTQNLLDKIYAVDDHGRTYDNTLVLLDKALEELKITQSALYVLSLASPDEQVRTASAQGFSRLQAFAVEAISLQEKLYKAVLAYQKRLIEEKHEILTPEQQYFLEETVKEFKRSGLQLSQEQQHRIKALQNEITQSTMAFDRNIGASNSTIELPREALRGLEDSFIDCLKRTDNGLFILTADQTHVLTVLSRCEVASTREKIYHAFMQRAYPENEKVLERILVLSDELAKLLGFESSAHYALDDQMAKSPERVKEFLATMFERSLPKAQKEFDLLKRELPPSVILQNGKIQPWDVVFVYDHYKKKHLQVDEVKISEYFPLDYTLPALLKVYEDFFGICFTKIKHVELWHPDLQAYAVYKKGQYRGIIIIDLFPRPHKFTHAGHVTVVPSLQDTSGKILPGVGVLLVNFAPAKPGQPALLKRTEVIHFFHEFGHALHALLGATELASTSGTNTKTDFVEMPSQMLEEWLWDPHILKAVSSHMKTKEPLPDDIIQNIVASKHVETGDMMQRQIFLANASLAYFLSGATKSVSELWRSLSEKLRTNIVADPHNKGYCSFVHLASYGPRYYGYLWSKVFALDLFATIKPYGLRNPEIGAKYVNEVLSKGGSTDPENLLKAFLGREPSTDAFFKDLGLDS